MIRACVGGVCGREVGTLKGKYAIAARKLVCLIERNCRSPNSSGEVESLDWGCMLALRDHLLKCLSTYLSPWLFINSHRTWSERTHADVIITLPPEE